MAPTQLLTAINCDPDELHTSEQRNQHLEQELASTLEQNRSLALVEEKGQTLASKIARLQVPGCAHSVRMQLEECLCGCSLVQMGVPHADQSVCARMRTKDCSTLMLSARWHKQTRGSGEWHHRSPVCARSLLTPCPQGGCSGPARHRCRDRLGNQGSAGSLLLLLAHSYRETPVVL